MSTITFTVELPTNEDGTIDQVASESVIQDAFARRVQDVETECTKIENVVADIFDEHRGESLRMPWLASTACQRLNCPPETFNTLSERVLSFVRRNSCEGGIFRISKGKGGGAARVSDLPAKE